MKNFSLIHDIFREKIPIYFKFSQTASTSTFKASIYFIIPKARRQTSQINCPNALLLESASQGSLTAALSRVILIYLLTFLLSPSALTRHPSIVEPSVTHSPGSTSIIELRDASFTSCSKNKAHLPRETLPRVTSHLFFGDPDLVRKTFLFPPSMRRLTTSDSAQNFSLSAP